MNIFVTCSSALEPILLKELETLGYPQGKIDYKGVYVPDVTIEDIYRINYLSRVAIRVLLPIHRFNVHDQKSLYQSISKIDWSQWIPQNKTFAIDSHVSHKQLTNSLFAAQKTKDAICDQLKESRGFRPNIDTKNPDIKLNLFIKDKRGIISFDTSLESLSRRGYRKHSVPAPLPESLAAALLLMVGYEGQSLGDPCCGSGTFLIEAAWIATNTPPGILRTKWGFESLPIHSPELWNKVKHSQKIQGSPKLWGIEKNPQYLQACQANLEDAGVDSLVTLTQGDFATTPFPFSIDWIFTNPPHGKRLQNEDALYESLGDLIKAHAQKGFVLTNNKSIRLKSHRKHIVHHSTDDMRLFEYHIFQK
jgi:putative N6-adenine-specific DNA methylase